MNSALVEPDETCDLINSIMASLEKLRSQNKALREWGHEWKDRALEPANSQQVIDWACARNRTAPNVAFEDGPERQAAYWIQWTEHKLRKKIFDHE